MTASSSASSSGPGPHARIAVTSPRERFAARLFDALWEQYRGRVEYVQAYERVVAAHGGTFVNDHIAFRTLAWQEPHLGIASVSRVFEALDYRGAGCYYFPDKHLAAVHFQHANPDFPKIFVSELHAWKLPTEARAAVERSLKQHRPSLGLDVLTQLHALGEGAGNASSDAAGDERLLATLTDWFQQRPWPAPQRSDVEQLNKVSQYAAWVLIHGYNVNHFTSLINSHGCEALGDIELTSEALLKAGVPMKQEIEGARGSKLRQTATEAVLIETAVRDGDREAKMPWSYAYFELAERGLAPDPETGRQARFEGFLGPQATQLFEMTRVK